MRFGLIGYPISHSQSPELFREFCGGRFPYDLIEEKDFEQAWRRFIEGPYKAVNVTAPFKTAALQRVLEAGGSADEETLEIGACNIVCKSRGRSEVEVTPRAYNSDYLGVKSIISGIMERPGGNGIRSAIVIGQGGAGRAALCAVRHLGMETAVLRHDELRDRGPIEADIIIYTLPGRVDGIENLRAEYLVEANYLNPCLSGRNFPEYIPGEVWLKAQAEAGFPLLLN